MSRALAWLTFVNSGEIHSLGAKPLISTGFPEIKNLQRNTLFHEEGLSLIYINHRPSFTSAGSAWQLSPSRTRFLNAFVYYPSRLFHTQSNGVSGPSFPFFIFVMTVLFSLGDIPHHNRCCSPPRRSTVMSSATALGCWSWRVLPSFTTNGWGRISTAGAGPIFIHHTSQYFAVWQVIWCVEYRPR